MIIYNQGEFYTSSENDLKIMYTDDIPQNKKEPERLIHYVQNHEELKDGARGERDPVRLPELFEQLSAGAHSKNAWSDDCLGQGLTPDHIHCVEPFAFKRKLRLDVLAAEDRFQVHPLSLHLKPLFNNFRNKNESGLPLVNLHFKWFLEWGETH